MIDEWEQYLEEGAEDGRDFDLIKQYHEYDPSEDDSLGEEVEDDGDLLDEIRNVPYTEWIWHKT
jgi:hypothetical protein